MDRFWRLGLSALLVAGAGFGIGYVVADDGADASDYGFDRSAMAHMMIGGELQDRVGQHERMLEGLRNEMSPEMREQLDDDELFQMMQDGSLHDMMNELGGMMGMMPGMGGGRSGRHGGMGR